MPQYDVALPAPGTTATIWLRLAISAGSPNIVDNYTPVSWQTWLEKIGTAGGPWALADVCTGWTIINDDYVLNYGEFDYDFRPSGGTAPPRILGSGTVNVPHNADGTKVLTFSAGWSEPHNLIGNGSLSNGLTLARIPRGPRVKQGGQYKNTVAYVKQGGQYKIAIPYVKNAGQYKIGGG